MEINNFYTVTVYEKGAEVVRLQRTLVGGHEGFAKGMKLYFERHDGHAVTCDDFAQAIADANPGSPLATHLEQFKRWYSQSGTPRVKAVGQYDAGAQTYTLTLTQSCPPTPGQPSKLPFVIHVATGLIAHDGSELPLQLEGEAAASTTCHTLVLTQTSQSFTFINVAQEPVPSLLRGFSAPVVLEHDYSDAALLTLLASDSDAFNRWEAGQRLLLRTTLNAIAAGAGNTSAAGQNALISATVVDALRAVLRHPQLDAAFKELVLTLPSEAYIAEQVAVVDPQQIHTVRETLRAQLARELQADWAWAFEAHQASGAYQPDAVSSGRRALTGLALSMLCFAARESGDTVWPGKALQRFKGASNMTDRLGALGALVASGHELATPALERFHDRFKDDALVLDKWFALQAGRPDRGGDVLPAVQQLVKHPDFTLKNPNRARSLIFSYCSANPAGFHRPDGAGYAFWADQVLALDAFNPQVAARLARALDRWKKLAKPYRELARAAIERVAAAPKLSNDVRELVTHALAD